VQKRPRREAVGEPAMMFRDVTASAGTDFHWGHRSLSRLTILDTVVHGCAFLDYDNDGRWDILLVGDNRCALFRNKGDGTFEDVSKTALPPPPTQGRMLGCAIADYDGDGKPDIFVSGYGVTRLYHNAGNGTFQDVTAGSGVEAGGPNDWITSAAWADIDGDGRPDLYVCRYVRFDATTEQLCDYQALDGSSLPMACGPTTYISQVGSMYHNEGNGHFRDITQDAGLADAHGGSLGCLFCDFNNDGRPDLYIANDRRLSDLYLNLGKGRFKNIGMSSGTAYNSDGQPMSGMGVAWGDYNNDGRFDLLVTTFQNEPKSLFQNDGDALFSQQNYASGLGVASIRNLAFGCAFVDVDNDGLLDIAIANGHVLSEIEKVDDSTTYRQSAQLFRNLGGGRFVDVSAQAGPDFTRKIVGRGLAVGDYDGDGKVDLLMVDDEGRPHLLHNENKTENHWLSLRCLNAPNGSDALGAHVAISVKGQRMISEVRAGGSYLSTDAPELHFGLGNARLVEYLEIRWPDGHVSRSDNVAVDHAYRISESEGRLE